MIEYKRGHRSIDRPITSDRNECRQTDKTGKQTNNKNKQSGSNPPKGMPQAESHKSVDSASQGGYSWPVANWEQRYATYLQRDIRTVPVRSENRETRLGDCGLLRARAGVTVRGAGVAKGRRSVPIREGWRFAGVGRDRPITHARACVAGSFICGSDRRLRVGVPARADRRVWVRWCGGGRGCQG